MRLHGGGQHTYVTLWVDGSQYVMAFRADGDSPTLPCSSGFIIIVSAYLSSPAPAQVQQRPGDRRVTMSGLMGGHTTEQQRQQQQQEEEEQARSGLSWVARWSEAYSQPYRLCIIMITVRPLDWLRFTYMQLRVAIPILVYLCRGAGIGSTSARVRACGRTQQTQLQPGHHSQVSMMTMAGRQRGLSSWMETGGAAAAAMVGRLQRERPPLPSSSSSLRARCCCSRASRTAPVQPEHECRLCSSCHHAKVISQQRKSGPNSRRPTGGLGGSHRTFRVL
jgi:hypothetical protein